MSTFIFDIDGTLIDSVPAYLKGLQKTMRRHGREYALEELTFSNGIPSTETAAHLGFTGDAAQALIDEWIEDSKPFSAAVDWIPGMPETMQALRQKGHRLGIVTSKDAAEFDLDNAKYHFTDYVDTRIVAHDAKRNKPYADPILLALDRLDGQLQDAVYIGDTKTDSLAAQNAGVRFALATWTSKPTADLEPIAYALKKPEDLLTL
ncbi:HAD family hydrolase [Lacticaseibacillus sp. GG6-2]